MSVFSVIGKIATTVYSIGKIVLPFLQSARQVSDPIEDAVAAFERAIEKGEVAADDFFDRNIKTVYDMDEFFADLIDIGTAGKATTEQIITFSQVESPDEITPQEAKELGILLFNLQDAIRDLGSKEELEASLAAMK